MAHLQFWHDIPEDRTHDEEDHNATGAGGMEGTGGGTWWPVVVSQLVGDEDRPFVETTANYVYVVVCWYQVQDSPLLA